MKGLITRTHNRFYHVQTDTGTYLCSPKGIFKKAPTPGYRLPVIGDRVVVDLSATGNEGVDGYITEILPRQNLLERADADGRKKRVMAANLDRVLQINAVAQPGLDFGLIDRYILTCQLADIAYVMVLNKIDLAPGDAGEPRLDTYRALEIPILVTSAKDGTGLNSLRKKVARGISFLTGTTGVGKSSLINRLVPEASLPTQTVGRKKGRGRHTTTLSTLVPLGSQGFLADSPGLRDFYPPRVNAEEVRFGFQEMAAHQQTCRFSTCLHDREPGCAVRQAVKDGLISIHRYKSYLFLLNEMRAFAQNRY